MKQFSKFFVAAIIFVGFGQLHASAQSFIHSEYPISFEVDDLELADFDRDGKLEVVFIARTEPGVSKVLIHDLSDLGDLKGEYSLDAIDNPRIQVHDINNDGYVELVISGSRAEEPYLEILTHKGDFSFLSLHPSLPQLLTPFQFLDVNMDGKIDLLGKINDNPDSINYAFINTENGFEKCIECQFEISGLPIGTIDIKNDGFRDLITNRDSSIELYENYNLTDTLITSIAEQALNYRIEFGDMTQNGRDEILLLLQEESGNSFIEIMAFDSSNFKSLSRIELEEIPNHYKVADFTNDGYLDILSQEQDTLYLYLLEGLDTLEKKKITSDIIVDQVSVGDYDFDHDLDIILSGIVNGVHVVRLIENDYGTNSPPVNPSSSTLVSFVRGDTVELRWGPGYDETTPMQSLTYEVHLYDETGNSVLPLHSAANRHISAYGSQLHTQSFLLRDLKPGIYKWAVQSIDNSLAAPYCQGNGGCCAQFTISNEAEEAYALCKGDTVNISLPSNKITIWKSRNMGVLDTTDVLTYVATMDDNVYTTYEVDNCVTETYNFTIQLKENYLINVPDFNVCAGETIFHTLEGDIAEANWQFLSSRDSTLGRTINKRVINSDLLVISVTNQPGCTTQDTVSVEVSSLPNIIGKYDANIARNESIQLYAEGGLTYEWSPATGLNDTNSASPMASTKETITYTVTGYNEMGCYNSDQVEITVTNLAFVPNLFSPNGDGQNDTFKVYAEDIASATLVVVNSMGQEVFRGQINSSSSAEWDGTHNGKQSPQGTYVWSLSGKYDDGLSIDEIGPSSGTVTLIR